MEFNELPEWFKWAFGGAGLSVIGAAWYFLKPTEEKPSTNKNKNVNKVEINQNFYDKRGIQNKTVVPGKKKFTSIEEAKTSARLLFIDDDTRFNLVKILKKAGWPNVDIIKDVSNLEDKTLKFSDIVFVDIQGVGKQMNFQDEGLGLSKAIIDRYPEKYLVIYSSERDGNRFHEAIRKADDQLYKHADSYEFEKCIVDLLVG